MKQRGKNGQNAGNVTKTCRTWKTTCWKNEELKKVEEALPRLKECNFWEGVEALQGKDRSRMRRLPPKDASVFVQRNKRRIGGILGEGGTVLEMAATSLYDDVLLDSQELYE